MSTDTVDQPKVQGSYILSTAETHTSTLADKLSNNEAAQTGGTPTDQVMSVDVGNQGAYLPIDQECNLSPYLCFPSFRDCTPTRLPSECEKWGSSLNTPESQSIAPCQGSSTISSPTSSVDGDTLVQSQTDVNAKVTKNLTEVSQALKIEEEAPNRDN